MRNLWSIGIGITFLFISCEDSPPFRKINVPDTPVSFSSARMDHDVFTANYSNPGAARQQLYQKYGTFYCHYLEDILRIGPCESDSSAAALEGFVTWPDMAELQGEVDGKYTGETIESMDQDFRQALQRWSFFFPDSVIPSVVYMNSGLNYSAYCTDSVWAVGLDYFLGPDNRLMEKLPSDLFPGYLKEDMRPDYAVVNTIKDFCQRETSQSTPFSSRPDLLSLLIFHGKVMFLTDALMPDAADSTKMNWTAEQLSWAQANEWNTWKNIAQQEIMFGTDMKANVRWFDFGPFTNAGSVPHDSPPQLGIWMGWNIVRAFMMEHPDMTPSQLLLNSNDREILQAYKPKR